MPALGAYLGGLAAGFVSGVTGSLFTVPTRTDAKLAICVQKWPWANTWLFFTLFNILLNLILAQAVFGLDLVQRAYSAVNTSSQLAVLLSSALWALGTVLFGLGVELSGVAMGVGLAMTSQIIFGTLLPLFNNSEALKEVVTTAKGGLTLGGVGLSIVGFVILGRASWLRDHAKQQQVGGNVDKEEKSLNGGSSSIPPPTYNTAEELKVSDGVQGAIEYQPINISIQEPVEEAARSNMLWLGVVVSLFAGVFSSLLQYAFVFGSDVVHYVEEVEGVSPMASSIIIWTVAIAVNNLTQAVGLVIMITYRGLWGRYWEGGRENFVKNTLRCLLMALFLNAHIELYGLAQACLGPLGPVLSWPLVMATVVLFSQVWGILLNEWSGASRKAVHTNWLSLGVISGAIVIISIAASL